MDLFGFIKGRGRKIVLFLFDTFCFAACNFLYYVFSDYSNFIEAPPPLRTFLGTAAILFTCIFGLRLLFRLYANVWRYTNTYANLNIVCADGLGCILACGIFIISGTRGGFWHPLIVSMANLLLALTSRFCYRILFKKLNATRPEGQSQLNVAIVGAGHIGIILANELNYNHDSPYRPVFFIDNDSTKYGSRISGLPVFHERDAVSRYLKEYGVKEVFIALNNVDSDLAAWLFDFYGKTGCKVRIYDTPIRDITENGTHEENSKRIIRDFQIEDLLFRTPLKLDGDILTSFYSGKTILVTGGGGSIGSELCRQIAALEPSQLIIFDIYENNAYDIQQELLRKYAGSLDLRVEIGSVRDRARVENIFERYKPDIVFHAAAHKHVPLMEVSGGEAIKNNVFGTKNVADMAEKYDTAKFILISTDKAVNPTNIMGASKRLCEMIVQSRNDSRTSFAAVRFGNVLGSNGSVIPLFKRQIASGGPITITDKRIIRYFMTIPEASQLVMTAGAMAKSGELFVLDMGKPIRIYDLAVNMIKLSGLEPNLDIKIKEIGLRPGEKLYEELLIKAETLTKTENDLIFIEHDAPMTRAEMSDILDRLAKAIEAADNSEDGVGDVREVIAETVPTFCEPNVVNERAEESDEMKRCCV